MNWPESGYKVSEIPQATIRNLLKRINAEFANDYDDRAYEQYCVGTFFPKLAASSEMRAYGNELARIFRLDPSLVCDSAQISLRLPGTNPNNVGWHIDGVPHPGNGVIAEHSPQCVAILGIYLSDVMRSSHGALQLLPGSHLAIQSFAKERGWNVLRRGVLPELTCAPDAIVGAAGTAVLFHPYMIHRAITNQSEHIRYALYFRYYDRRASS